MLWGGEGGMVENGLGDVRAKTRAAAIESAKKLNSAQGVTWVLESQWMLASG